MAAFTLNREYDPASGPVGATGCPDSYTPRAVSAAKPVFISYAVASAHGAAAAIEAALGADRVFRDASNLQFGKAFPAQIFDALIEARLIICLLDEAYFSSWFCRAELEIALAAWRDSGRLEAATRRLIFAIHPDSNYAGLRELPPPLRTIQWPLWTDLPTIEAMAEQLLASPDSASLRVSLAPQRVDDLWSLVDEQSLMPPRKPLIDRQHSVGLPAMPEGRFFGRGLVLAALHALLLTPGGTGLAAVVAPGGVGKTRLALEYAWRHGSRDYPGGIFWLNAAAPDSRDSQFYQVLSRFIPDLPPLAALRQARFDFAGRLREILEEHASEGPFLWIVDNFPEPAPGERPPEVASWAPVGKAPVAVLLTSRMRLTPDAINLELFTLDREAAKLLLRRELSAEQITPVEADQIAAAAGDWPLALELLNASFRAGAMTPAEFLEHHRRSDTGGQLDSTMFALEGQVPDAVLRGLSESLLLSYERLKPGARRLARALSHFAAATPIPLELFDALPGDIRTLSAHQSLVTRHVLLAPSSETAGSLHPVVADFLRTQDPEHDGEWAAWQSLEQMSTECDPTQPDHWPIINLVLPHGQALWGRGGIRPPTAARLGAWMATSTQEQGQYSVAIRMWESLRTDSDCARQMTAEEALEYERRCSEALWRGGQLPAARLLLESILARAAELGDQHPLILRARGNLAILHQLSGELAEAQLLMEDVWQQQMRVNGPEHPDTLRTQGNCAMLLSQRGQAQASLDLYLQTLQTMERTLGPDHPFTVNTFANSADPYSLLGRFAEALRVTKAALHTRERLLGPDHVDTLRSRHNLAVAYRDLGDLKTATLIEEASAATYRRVFGIQHHSTLNVQFSLAFDLRLMGQLEEAEALFHQTLAPLELMVGPSHPRALMVQMHIALLHRMRGSYSEALATYDRYLPDYGASLGADHPWYLEAQVDRALTELLAGEEATATLQSLVTRCELALGENNPSTLEAIQAYASALLETGDATQALQQVRRVFAARAAMLPLAHFQRTESAFLLYRALHATDALSEAHAIYTQELSWLLASDAELHAWSQHSIRQQLPGCLSSQTAVT